jgi:hypothetical protein
VGHAHGADWPPADLGPRLRAILGSALKNRARAFLAGLGVTAILQSSTATGLMAAGFAAGGLVDLVPALAVMLAANVGTTLIVQVFSFDVTAATPVLILIIGLSPFPAEGTRAQLRPIHQPKANHHRGDSGQIAHRADDAVDGNDHVGAESANSKKWRDVGGALLAFRSGGHRSSPNQGIQANYQLLLKCDRSIHVAINERSYRAGGIFLRTTRDQAFAITIVDNKPWTIAQLGYREPDAFTHHYTHAFR